MPDFFLLQKGFCDVCDERNHWTTVLTRKNDYPLYKNEIEDAGLRICLSCIYDLQKDAAVIARLEAKKPQAPATPVKKPGKKKGKKVSAVTAGTGGEG